MFYTETHESRDKVYLLYYKSAFALALIIDLKIVTCTTSAHFFRRFEINSECFSCLLYENDHVYPS